MGDRSVPQLDAALRRMNSASVLPARKEGESFRSYFVRVVPTWIEAHGDAQRDLTAHLQALVAREYRGHPRLADQQPLPQMRPKPSQQPAREPG